MTEDANGTGGVGPALDLDGALERLDGDMELLKELFEMFFDISPDQLTEIKQAIEQADPELVAKTSHALKGAAGNVGAVSTFELCHRLETMGREAVLDAALGTVEELEAELERLHHDAIAKGLLAGT